MHRPRDNDQFNANFTKVSLNDVVVVEFGPLEDVLLTHNVWVDEQVAVPHAEVLLTGRAFETLQMVNLVPNAHRHLKRSDPLLAGSTEAVLTKKPEEDISVRKCSQNVAKKKKKTPFVASFKNDSFFSAVSFVPHANSGWNPDVLDLTPTWGSLSDTAFFPACSKAGGPPPRVDSRTGHSSGSPRASTAQWPSGRICRRCSAGSRHTSAETEASAGPRPLAPCTAEWLEQTPIFTGANLHFALKI